MKSELTMVPKRIKELREILEIACSVMAEKLNMSVSDYEKIESGDVDIPISVLYEIGEILGVDSTVLLTGDSPKMNTYSVTRAGDGVVVERYPGYSYQSLSFNFQHRIMDPLLVTLSASDDEPALITHSGQEFNYIVEGSVKVTVGDKQFVLNAGDSIYFDPTLPHGQASVKGKSVFLTVIKEL